MNRVQERNAELRKLTEAVDCRTPAGRMMTQTVASFAEFERTMLKERTQIGLYAARADERVGGRKRKLNPQQRHEILQLVRTGKKEALPMPRGHSGYTKQRSPDYCGECSLLSRMLAVIIA